MEYHGACCDGFFEMSPPTGFFSFMNVSTVHIPVLLAPVLQGLGLTGEDADPSGISRPETPERTRCIVDGTLGGGGHTLRILQCLAPGDCVLGIDRDPSAVRRFVEGMVRDGWQRSGCVAMNTADSGTADSATAGTWSADTRTVVSGDQDSDSEQVIELRLPSKPGYPRLLVACGSYCDLPDILMQQGLGKVDGILLDLGLSSDQLQDPSRGFSFKATGPLDLRFNPEAGISAAELLQRRSEQEIADLIYQFGEERFSRRIARAIVERRRTSPIETAEELADLVHRVLPGRIHGRIDSATRTFQALRIAVNRELEHVEHAMETLPACLSEGGRLVIISFHSLEDRIVKHAMRGDPRLKVLTKKPIEADEVEVSSNPRSRSAKLRVAERRVEEIAN